MITTRPTRATSKKNFTNIRRPLMRAVQRSSATLCDVAAQTPCATRLYTPCGPSDRWASSPHHIGAEGW